MPSPNSFVFFSSDSEHATALAALVEPLGQLYLEAPTSDTLRNTLTGDLPDLVLLDFMPQHDKPEKLHDASGFARELGRVHPTLCCVAVGCSQHPGSAIAALRAGVSEYVDLQQPDDLIDTLERLLAARPAAARSVNPDYRSVVIQGVRPGLGSSTLAVHLASLLQRAVLTRSVENNGPDRRGVINQDAHAETALRVRVALLDLGLPIADCMLYTNVSGAFDFTDAVRNLERLDPVMLLSALAHSKTNLSVLPLSRDLTQLDTVQSHEVSMLCERLMACYASVVADVGGLESPGVISALSHSCDERWLVTDQSIGSLVSLADCLAESAQQDILAGKLFLVVNHYDPRYGLSARQISERFNIPLKGVLPDRSLQLRKSANTGKLLHHVAPHDPYIKAVKALLATLMIKPTHATSRPGLLHWLRRRRQQSSA